MKNNRKILLTPTILFVNLASYQGNCAYSLTSPAKAGFLHSTPKVEQSDYKNLNPVNIKKSASPRLKLRYIKLFTKMLAKRYGHDMGKPVTPSIQLFHHIIEQALDDLFPRKSRHKSEPEVCATQKDAQQYFKCSTFEEHAYHCGLEPDWLRMKLQQLNLINFSNNGSPR